MNMEWKNKLLSSNIPLQFEAARELVSKNFAVNSDYRYWGSDIASESSVPVDIHAAAIVPLSAPQQMTAKIEMLITCKHAHSDQGWVFMPDLNRPDYSPVNPGNTIRIVDKFSPYAVDGQASVDFDRDVPKCYKGFEIDFNSGNLAETPIGLKLSQLQNAIPRLLTENVLLFLNLDPRNNVPFIFAPVLLTTAQLFVVKKDASIEELEQASDIRDIAEPVPLVIMFRDYGPEFSALCSRESSRMKSVYKNDKAMIVEQKRARYFQNQFNLPFTIIESLISEDRFYLNTFFTQFLICTRNHFPALVDAVVKTAESALLTRTWIE